MELDGRHTIAGKRSGAAQGAFRAFDPGRGEALDPAYPDATSEEVASAAEAAAEAAEALHRVDPEVRAAFLDAVAEEIEGLGEVLLERARRETALPPPRLAGERGRTVGQLRMFAELVREGSWVEARIDTALPDREPLPRPDLRRMLVPLGPVAVFGASNFPLAFSVAGGDTASAWAAGCPVVVKAHPAHPGTSELVGRAIDAAVARLDLPPGIFSMVHGVAHRVGEELVLQPAIRAVGFTGSLQGGRALFDLACRREAPIPVYAEMGSSNPVFVLPGAARDRGEAIAAGLAASVTLGAGQFCTNPGLTVFLDDGDGGGLMERAASLLREAGPLTVVHPGIKSAYDAALEEVGRLEGISTAARSEVTATAVGETEVRSALLLIDAAAYARHERLGREIYGPCTVGVRCADRDEVLDLARSLEGHLTATVHGTEEELAEWGDLLEILREKAGRLIFNGFPTGVEVSPAMHHGGPYPATTDSRATSVGTAAIGRFARPVCWQDFPQSALPAELRDANPRGLWRLVDGRLTREAV